MSSFVSGVSHVSNESWLGCFISCSEVLSEGLVSRGDVVIAGVVNVIVLLLAFLIVSVGRGQHPHSIALSRLWHLSLMRMG